jgi:hypothetical protein
VKGDELFGAVPARVYEALRFAEMTFDEFGVACWLCGVANHRTKTYIGTLAEIRSRSRFKKSDDTLGRVLDSLTAKEWIDLTKRQGQRSAYVIRLTGLLRLPHDFRKNDPLDAEVTSADGASATSANAQPERDSAADELPHVSEPASTSTALRREDHLVGEGTREAPLDFDSLTPDVKAAVERGRALVGNKQDGGLRDDEFEFYGTARWDDIERGYDQEDDG